MIPKHVCSLCNVSFNQASDLRRHQRTKHENNTNSCADCGKSFNRVDNLQRHQAKCRMLRFKCPRCHRFMSSMNSLTEHMGLYSQNARGCAKWQWNARDCVTGLHDWKTGPSHQKSAKRSKSRGQFYCGRCLQSFEDRGEWFNHKLTHVEDEYVLWRHTMHEWVMNIHYQNKNQGWFINIIRTPSKQWGMCDNVLYPPVDNVKINS